MCGVGFFLAIYQPNVLDKEQQINYFLIVHLEFDRLLRLKVIKFQRAIDF